MKRPRVRDGHGLFDLAESAVHMVRTAPMSVLTPYLLGTIPFLLSFLYFWSDMLHGAYAWRYPGRAAVGVAFAFVWMKCWHAIYCYRLRAVLSGGTLEPLNFARVLRLVGAQTFLHATGLILVPLAMIIVAPFGHVYAFYQNASVYGADPENSLRDVVRNAWREARRWPNQNWKALWLLSPYPLILAAAIQLILMPIFRVATPEWSTIYAMIYFWLLTIAVVPLSPIGTLLAFNFFILIVFIPSMLKSLLGIETVMSLGGDSGNTALYAVCVGAAFLCMDPVMKAAYTLRCFYGESVTTGEDLRVSLNAVINARNIRAGLVLFTVASALMSGAAFAQEPEVPAESSPTIAPAELDRAISSTLEQSEYAWRLPREIPEGAFEQNFLTVFLESILVTIGEALKTLGRAISWFLDLFSSSSRPSEGLINWQTATFALWIIMLAGVLVALLIIIYRIIKQRQIPAVEAQATPVLVTPDLEEDDVTADALPEDGWLDLARDLIGRGEYRLAMRALFLATLAVLAHRDLIRIAKYKSNREYLREMERFAHAAPDIPPAFAETVSLFERVWYGRHALDQSAFNIFNSQQERIRALAKQH